MFTKALLKNTKAVLIGFAIILGVSLTLRTYNLYSNPAGFFCDEAAIGYNAYTILTTGKDEYGKVFPVFFKSFGEYKDPIQIYSTVPFVGLLGLNEWAVRLPSVLYGILIITFLFLLGKEIMNKYFGLLVALVAATMPWLIHYSRIAFEIECYAAFFTLTIYLFRKAANQKYFIIPAFIVAAVTLYTYQPAKLIVILLLIGVLYIYRIEYLRYKRELLTGCLVFSIISIPLILSIFNGQFAARFNYVSVFSAHLSLLNTMLLVVHNYFIQLFPSYFIFGENTYITRHFTDGLIPLLPITLPFLIIGLLKTISTIRTKNSQLLMYWLIIYPIAGAVTAEAPFTGRSVIGAPLFAVLISLGLITSLSWIKRSIHKYIYTLTVIVIFVVSLALFTQFYFTQYPLNSADFSGWQFGPKDIISYFVANKSSYDSEFLEPNGFNAPYIFFKFYAPQDCNQCKLGTPYNSYNPLKRQLFALTPAYIFTHQKFIYIPVKNIYYPDGKLAFVLSQVKLR